VTTRRGVPSGAAARLGAGAAIAVGLLLSLAATIGPLGSTGGPGASLVVHLSDTVRAVVTGLLALSAVILFSMVRRRPATEDVPRARRVRQRPPAWAALVSLLPLLVLALAWYLVGRHWAGPDGQPGEGPFAALAGLLDLFARGRKPPTSIPFFDHVIALLLVLISLAIFSLMVLIAMAGQLERWWSGRAVVAAAPVAAALAEARGDLRTEPDARAAVIRAYRRFEGALAAAHAPRAPWQTPAEFMRSTLARLPVPAQPIQRLTALFEIARFSDRVMDSEARDAACDCLDEITSVLAEEPAREG
jgi:hypothetical protein